MEYIIENVDEKTFVKVNGKLTAGIAFLKIFESESDAQDFIEEKFPHEPALQVVKYEGFTP